MNSSEAIKAIRKKTFFSQEDFAKELGVSFTTVNRWETGKTKPNYKTIRRILDFCEKNKMDKEYANALMEEAYHD